MMEGYWPTAGDLPNASRHDREHSRWYNQVDKIVLSKSLKSGPPKTKFISGDIASEVTKIKSGPGKNIMIFGSPQAVHMLSQHDLIDEYWLFVNPIVLGRGIPLFKGIREPKKLSLADSKAFPRNVIALHYLLRL
jgi:dihydrofolate reductase